MSKRKSEKPLYEEKRAIKEGREKELLNKYTDGKGFDSKYTQPPVQVCPPL